MTEPKKATGILDPSLLTNIVGDSPLSLTPAWVAAKEVATKRAGLFRTIAVGIGTAVVVLLGFIAYERTK
jgi:hypothetical protein